MQDEHGVIHSPYGSFNPVTGEGYPIDAPKQFMDEILHELIQEGLDSGIDNEFDIGQWLTESFPDDRDV